MVSATYQMLSVINRFAAFFIKKRRIIAIFILFSFIIFINYFFKFAIKFINFQILLKIMNYKTLLFEKKNNIAKVILNRANKLNALNKLMMSELEKCIKSIEKDKSIRALIITGSGEKAFVACADIKELNENDRSSGRQFAEFGSSVFSRIEQMRIPVVAAINGYALGGGCELALCCHIRFASENAKLGQTELNLGLIPGYGGTQRLPRIVW
jgi:enoyl-CoA hydratase